jgi:PAT family beta-lactamase induction signal transducer AmpG
MSKYFNQRLIISLLLGFSSGLPLALTSSTLQAWMTTEKVDLSLIGVFSLVGMPYALKFLWSPLFDRFSAPFLGRRRGWILVFQILLVLSILFLSQLNPVQNTFLLAITAVFISFFSASQDIVIDAYRTELLHQEEYGLGSAVSIMGYRVAMIFSGGFALLLSDKMEWRWVYTIMSFSLVIGILASILSPEPKFQEKAPRTIYEAVIDPFLDFFKRKGSLEMLLFLILYKIDVFLTLAMSTPFLISVGFSKTEIGLVSKGFGMAATIIGTLFGGSIMIKLKMKKSLWLFGVLQAISGLSYMAIAFIGPNHLALISAISIENICSGMGISAYSAFMMSLCNKKYTVTQYALLTSFMAFSRTIVQAPSGYLVQIFDWKTYFLICTLAGIPGLILLLRYPKWSVEKTI